MKREEIFRNNQLSLSEKGLYSIFCNNKNTVLTMADLIRVSLETPEKIRDILKALVNYGLIKKENNCFRINDLQKKKKQPIRNLITRDELEDMYNLQRLSTFEIAARLNHNAESVRRLMDKYGIKRRTDSRGSIEYFKKKSTVKEEFFLKKTPELHYTIGLFLSDGYIGKAKEIKNRDGTTKKVGNDKIGIELIDKDVIEWIANVIEYKNKIYVRKRSQSLKTTYTIQFTNNTALSVLREYGMVECKSNILVVEEHLDRHLIRGIFEGDGSISKSKDGRFIVTFYSGSKEFITTLRNTIEKAVGGTTQISIKENTNGNKSYSFAICKQEKVKEFGEFIYGGDVFGMERKKKMFKELGSNFNK